MKTKIAAGFAVSTLLIASACGGGRPSVDEIADALEDSDNPVTVASGGVINEDNSECFAEIFHESDLSDDTLQAIVDGDEDYEGDEDEEEALESISEDDIMECIGDPTMDETP